MIPHYRKNYHLMSNVSVCSNIIIKVWISLEEGKMGVIAKGVGRGNDTDSEVEKKTIRQNMLKFIVNQSKTSGHKVIFSLSIPSQLKI